MFQKHSSKEKKMRMLKVVFVLIHLLAAAVLANPLSKNDFPPHFLFGASSSAYQVEDAANEDGRKPSIWDTFVHAAGNAKIHRGDKDIGCDQYHKYKEDVKLMVKMGLDAYRFSISWSRLVPDGKGPINPKGLQYYNNLINELISQGIQPHITLHHLDLPQALEDEYGGWLRRRVVKDFTAYADVCFREFGDRVKYWTTVNEGNLFAFGGYESGLLPPQRCSPSSIPNCSRGNSSTEPYLVAHHILLAHASAARLYRKKYQDKQHGFIGLNLLTFGFVPLTKTSDDINATQRAQDFYTGWFLNPLIFGEYPGIMKKNAGSRLPVFTKRESNLVKGSMDFLGINFYYTFLVKNNPDSLRSEDRSFTADMAAELEYLTGNGSSTYEHPITPWILKEILASLKKDYGNFPVYIHENGQQTQRNSSLDDRPRVKYLCKYIGSLLDILRDGVNLRGYFVWSFLDMFEVLNGYESSYGLYFIDLKDPALRRQSKLSSVWYSNFLNNGNIPKVTIMDIEKNASVLSNTVTA
ncbi:beta-glucosidase 11-like isoform X2 [Lotus japonicus]|uniref:beta-glucosidase 11-like isoform X2 n=1 Tax=Lotus japonicus TaxID=34305 RepID=UPI0025831409|nr:beta-glucosidase 11-like isoform X2 [Lotus japonicus]